MARFNKKTLIYLLLLAFICIPMATTFAQDGSNFPAALNQTNEVQQPPLVTKVAVLAALAIMPYAIMLLTSFLKMVVVLALLRQALGVQNAPPNQVINGMAFLMTIYVMFPTGLAMYEAGESYIQKTPQTEAIFSTQNAQYIMGVAERTKEPLRNFLTINSLSKHRGYFYKLAKKKFPPSFRDKLKKNDFIVLIPSYITSQVKGAFEIGVLIYLPFFVIDLVTSNILLAMGMMMLSPLTIALPLKLLLLVMIDGWTLVVEGVVLSYR